MDNAQKAIMIGVGLFITIIIISAVLLVVNLGSGLMNDATSELGTISGSLRGQILDGWAGKTKSGSEVLAFIRQYSKSDTVSIVVTGATATKYIGAGVITVDGLNNVDNYTAAGFTDGEVTVGGTTGYSEFVDSGLVSTTAYYRSAVVYDVNDNVIGVAIIAQDYEAPVSPAT